MFLALAIGLFLPLLVQQVLEVRIVELEFVVRPCTIISRTFKMAATNGVCTAKCYNFLVLKALRMKDASQMMLIFIRLR